MKKHRFHQREVKPLKDTKIPGVWLFTDTETKVREDQGVDKHFFHLGWCFLCLPSWRDNVTDFQRHLFIDARAYLKYIDRTARSHAQLILCGHNVFFDLQAAGFFTYFYRAGWKLDYLYDKGLTFILKVVRAGSQLIILSTTNWFDCSVERLGDMIGLPKLEVDLERVTRTRLIDYCYRDTEIIMRAMHYYIEFITTHNLGRFCYTKASQSLVAYRTCFMQGRIFVHGEQDVHDLERKAYFGGRTEAYFIGTLPKGNYVTLDVNGMYPHVMRSFKYPGKLIGYLEDEPRERYEALLPGYLMIAEVTLDTPEPAFALRHNRKTVFPVGRFTTYLCTEGLKYALSRGYIKQFHRAAVYSPVDLFTLYVDYFKLLRTRYALVHNTVMETLCKYFHNSLYGKFGERKVETIKLPGDPGKEYHREEVYDMVRGGTWIETNLFGMQLYQHYEGETSHSSAAIAAHVTENARMYLWHNIRLTGRERTLYCDTDSVITREAHIPRLKGYIDDTRLGAMKVQNRFSELKIEGAKNYRTDAVRHIKGIPAKAKEVMPGVFEYMHFTRMCMCLRLRQSEGVPFEIKTRELKAPYDKGIVGPDGRVTPLIFPLPGQLF